MALKTLLLRSRLDMARANLEELRTHDADFERRESEIEAAITEMTEETSEEDRTTVEKQAEVFQSERDEHEKKEKDLEEEISRIEEELRAEEEKQPKPQKEEKRGEEKHMETRVNRGDFFGMNIQERDALLNREDVKKFFAEVRACIKNRRALTNVGLTIPDVLLPMIRQVATETSKLVKYVTVRQIGGTSRQNNGRHNRPLQHAGLCWS